LEVRIYHDRAFSFHYKPEYVMIILKVSAYLDVWKEALNRKKGNKP